MLIDTHAHINFKDYKDDGDEVIKRALENDVWLVNVGAELETSQRAVKYAEKYPQGVFAAVGLHPIHLQVQKFSAKGGFAPDGGKRDFEFETKAEKFDYEKYKILAQNPKVVAIGEIGLDYYRIMNYELGIKEKQKKIFEKQIELALELNKPIIIHCRNAHSAGSRQAHDDTLDILNSYFIIDPSRSRKRQHNSRLRGVVHSFSGNYEQARQYREMGFKIAFNGIITFARDYDKVILDTPLEDILVETDCPYLAPIPYRGKRNEPIYIIEVAKKIAEIKNFTVEEVARQTTLNAKEVFGL